MRTKSTKNYPLARVVETRTRARDEIREAFSENLRELERRRLAEAEAAEQKQILTAEHAEARGALYEPPSGDSISISLIERRSAAIDFLSQRVRDQEARLRSAREAVSNGQTKVEESRTALIEAELQLGAVHKHQETWQEKLKVEERRSEAKQMEEVATNRFVRDQVPEEIR